MTALRVAVVAGGPSSEAEVSRTSAAAIEDGLRRAGHAPVVIELDTRVAAPLGSGGFDVVFPIVHGPLGEDGCLQGLLEVLALPYVGSDVLASALAASKPAAKVAFRAEGLPVAADALVCRGDDLRVRASEVRAALGRRVVVKPSAAGSAIGVCRITEDDDDGAVARALEAALAISPSALVEAFATGHEVTCGVLDDPNGSPEALPPTLIVAKAADWYDFESRYAAGGSEHRCPAPFSPELNRRIQDIAVGAYRALGMRDLGRADFVVTDEGGVTLLEVNALPGFTPTSLFPEAAAVAGLDFPALCDRLVRRALARPRRDAPAAIPMP